jgi:hypothetical protein
VRWYGQNERLLFRNRSIVKRILAVKPDVRAVKPDVRDPVELQKTVIRRRGRPPKAATILQQEDELSDTSSRVSKRARQSTLSFVTPGDRMDE